MSSAASTSSFGGASAMTGGTGAGAGGGFGSSAGGSSNYSEDNSFSGYFGNGGGFASSFSVDSGAGEGPGSSNGSFGAAWGQQSFSPASAQQQKQQQHPLYKTQRCKNIDNGATCPRGADCNFAHTPEELRSPPSLGGTAANGNANGNNIMKRKANAKTVLCQNFQAMGDCQYGNSCTFAHGEGELQINKRQRLEQMTA